MKDHDHFAFLIAGGQCSGSGAGGDWRYLASVHVPFHRSHARPWKKRPRGVWRSKSNKRKNASRLGGFPLVPKETLVPTFYSCSSSPTSEMSGSAATDARQGATRAD